jgi:hypothetical protein
MPTWGRVARSRPIRTYPDGKPSERLANPLRMSGHAEFPSESPAPSSGRYELLNTFGTPFQSMDPASVARCVYETPISLVVLRTMLGFSPPELAYITSLRAGAKVDQGAARTIDRRIRMAPLESIRRKSGVTEQRIEALVSTACALITEGVPADTPAEILHRLEKADTKSGLDSLRTSADVGIPYAILLYERFLGRPFAAHRDSVSELPADHPGRVWPANDTVQSVTAGARRHVAGDAGCARGLRGRVRSPGGRQHRGARASLGGWGKRGQYRQAIARSRGGPTTKIHRACRRSGPSLRGDAGRRLGA